MAGVEGSGRDQPSVEATLARVEGLQANRNQRDAQGLFYIEGIRNFVQASESGFHLSKIIYSEKLLTSPLARKLVRSSRRSGVHVVRVTPEQFRRVCRSERASGIGAMVRQRWLSLRDVSPQAGLCWVILEHVRASGNLGTLVRTSDAVGGAGFIFLDDSVDPYSPNVVRASMGALFRQKLVRTGLASLHKWARRHGCVIVGASPDGSVCFHEFDKYSRVPLIALGEERRGLSQRLRDLCHHLVRIPMSGSADSLNLGVAGSLLMYEVYKSRTSSA